MSAGTTREPRLDPPTTDAATFAVIRRALDDAAALGCDFDRSPGDYPASYATPAQVAAVRSHYRCCVVDAVAGFAGSIGCDLGCWFGFSTLALRSLGARQVYGVDVDPRYVSTAERWSSASSIDGLAFLGCTDVVPLDDATMDWVVMNQVLCNAEPGAAEPLLAEATRVLRPGGRLVLTDSNNPHCPATLERLRASFRRYEIGDGGPDAPLGPHHRERRAIIAAMDVDLDDAAIDRLAADTCYLGGAALRAVVRAAVAGEPVTPSRFDPDGLRPTVEPSTGRANGNLTDPLHIRDTLLRLGCDAHVTVTPAGGPVSPDELDRQLRSSQGFYVYGTRRR